MSLNGHSSAITKDFYVRQERSKDVEHAINAFATITSPRQQSNVMLNVSSDSDEFEPAVPSVVAKCKIAIVDEPAAIFHPNHIVSNGRLKYSEKHETTCDCKVK